MGAGAPGSRGVLEREKVSEMIRFTREGTAVRVTISLAVPNYESRDFWFDRETNAGAYAGLLSAEFQKQMHDSLEKIRRESYREGWKDAKAKKSKRTYFRLGWFV